MVGFLAHVPAFCDFFFVFPSRGEYLLELIVSRCDWNSSDSLFLPTFSPRCSCCPCDCKSYLKTRSACNAFKRKWTIVRRAVSTVTFTGRQRTQRELDQILVRQPTSIEGTTRLPCRRLCNIGRLQSNCESTRVPIWYMYRRIRIRSLRFENSIFEKRKKRKTTRDNIHVRISKIFFY